MSTTKVSTIMQTPGTASEVFLHTTNGFGSTNTVIRRWTTTITNTGSDITYADSATLGGTFTINTTGLYAIHYSDEFNATIIWMGISVNSSQLTSAVHTITTADVIAINNCESASHTGGVSIVVKLTAGDVVRAHATVQPSGSSTALTRFAITRVG